MAEQRESERVASLAFAQRATPAEKLERQLLHAIELERRAASRVKRAANLLHKWSNARKRIERRIGEAEVRRIINRLSVTSVNRSEKD